MKSFKNKKLTAYVMAALMAGSAMLGTSFGASSAEAAVKVNPIAGISDDFIKGADGRQILRQWDGEGLSCDFAGKRY